MKYQYLPTSKNNCKETIISDKDREIKGVYPCPCCGYITLPVPREEAIAYICPVCFWENDIFIKTDDEPSDENHGMTLNQGRKNYKLFGACTEKMLAYVRKPRADKYAKG